MSRPGTSQTEGTTGDTLHLLMESYLERKQELNSGQDEDWESMVMRDEELHRDTLISLSLALFEDLKSRNEVVSELSLMSCLEETLDQYQRDADPCFQSDLWSLYEIARNIRNNLSDEERTKHVRREAVIERMLKSLLCWRPQRKSQTPSPSVEPESVLLDDLLERITREAKDYFDVDNIILLPQTTLEDEKWFSSKDIVRFLIQRTLEEAKVCWSLSDVHDMTSHLVEKIWPEIEKVDFNIIFSNHSDTDVDSMRMVFSEAKTVVFQELLMKWGCAEKLLLSLYLKDPQLEECIASSLKHHLMNPPEPTPELTPEPAPEPAPEPTAEPTAEFTPEFTPEPTAEFTPEFTPEPTPQPKSTIRSFFSSLRVSILKIRRRGRVDVKNIHGFSPGAPVLPILTTTKKKTGQSNQQKSATKSSQRTHAW